MRTWQNNADECREMEEGSGWAFAERVACSVVKTSRGGDQKSNSIRSLNQEKVSPGEFAKRWDTYESRVNRYLTRWDEEAAKGHVDPSSSLTPNDVGTLDTSSLPRWKGGKDTSPSADPKEIAKRWLKRLNPKEQVELMEALQEGMEVEEPTNPPTKDVREDDDPNVSSLGLLAEGVERLQKANSHADPHKLTERQTASAEVMLRGAEAEIAVWRDRVEGGVSDEAIAAVSEGRW